MILVDSPDPGSGKVFDWQLAEGAPSGVRMMLAGGLTPDNVGEAIHRVRPWGVDVVDRGRRTPGRKDADEAAASSSRPRVRPEPRSTTATHRSRPTTVMSRASPVRGTGNSTK